MILRRILQGLGALFLVLIIAIAVFIFNGIAADRESKEFVDKQVRVIVAEWAPDALIRVSTQELRKQINSDTIKQSFDKLRELGLPQGYGEPSGQAGYAFDITKLSGVTDAKYTDTVRYQDSDLRFDTVLKKPKGDWLFDKFEMHLVPHKAGAVSAPAAPSPRAK